MSPLGGLQGLHLLPCPCAAAVQLPGGSNPSLLGLVQGFPRALQWELLLHHFAVVEMSFFGPAPVAEMCLSHQGPLSITLQEPPPANPSWGLCYSLL